MKIICISGKAEAGKDTYAGLVAEALSPHRVLITHYGDLLKYVAKTFFAWDGEKDEKGRSLLQHIGTDVVRAQMPDFWVDFVADILTLFSDEWDYVLIPDCRFPNEIERLKERGFDVRTVHIERPEHNSRLTSEQRAHPSETALDDYDFDYTVLNDMSLDVLFYYAFIHAGLMRYSAF